MHAFKFHRKRTKRILNFTLDNLSGKLLKPQTPRRTLSRMTQSDMFHFQTVFSVNWIESDHIEIKPKRYSKPFQSFNSSRPTSISNTEVSFLSEILTITKNLSNVVLDFK